MVKKTFSRLLFLCLIFMLYVPASATTTDEHGISVNAGIAELAHKNDNGITLPIGTVTNVTNIERNVLINHKYEGPWQETCIDGTILYCDSNAEIKISEPYSYSDDGSMYEFRFYFGSIKPAEINRYHDVQIPDSIDTSGYSHAQVERITGDICLVEYWDFEVDDAGNLESLSTSFEGTHQLPDGTYYVEMIGAEVQKGNSANPSSIYSYPSAQFVVVVGEASYSADATTFSDVPTEAYYYDAVYWAVGQKIVNGTSPTTFTPNRTCTTAEIVTLLWRAAGQPASSAQLPFTVNESLKFAETAMRWAYEKGMINANFDQTSPCTRASTVKFLWQAEGSPIVSSTTKFTDVPAGADYAQAVAWAVSEGIVSGTTPTTFSPGLTCTRAQIVTLLYRGRAN